MPEKNTDRRGSPTGPQIWRLQKLIEWLRSGRSLTTRLAAEEFEKSRRTIASDIDYLRQLGVPVEFDRRRGTYLLTEPFENLPLVPLRRTELATLLVAQHALEAFGDASHAALLARTVEKLAEHFPETIHVEPDLLARTIRFESGPHPRVPLGHLEALETAVRDQRVAWIRYRSNNRAELTEREVEPYTLLSYQGRWYLIGYCRLREAMRDFRIDRIQALEVRREVFAIQTGFDLDVYLGPAFGMYRGDRTYAVHVRFTPYQARWIQEEHWHDSQIMTRRPDGSLDVRMQVTGLADVARWVLSYGAEAEVISPPVLRHRVASEARRMVGLYDGDATVSSQTPTLTDEH